MKITVIHGQNHKGITYTMTQEVLKYLKCPNDEIKEFFLPKDGPDFCKGCNNCFLLGEEKCPEATKVQPIAEAMEWADIIILDSPNYAMEMSGAMKNFLEHLAYRWVTHRPHELMFKKVGITISSSAGAPPLSTVKSMAKQLKWLCVPTVYTFPFVSSAMGVKNLGPDKRSKIAKKALKIAKKARHRAEKPRVTLRAKLQFLMFRKMQKSPKSAWNLTDQQWWRDKGWLENKVPWK